MHRMRAGLGCALAIAALALESSFGGGALAQTDGRFDVRAFGARGDGVADDTPAIRQALAQIASSINGGAKGAVLYFPPGRYRTTGGFDVSRLDGLNVVGDGPGITTIVISHASNDLFYWSTNVQNQHYRDFAVRSDVARTAGWVLRGGIGTPRGAGSLFHSRITDIDIQDQVNGFWIPKYEFVWIDRVKMATFVGDGGIGIKVGQQSADFDNNQGSELQIRATSITGRDLSQRSFVLAPPRLAYGFVIEDVDAVYITDSDASMALRSALLVKSNPGGHPPSNLFFDKASFDTTRDGPAAHFKGFAVGDLTIAGCVFANAGRMPGAGAPQPGLQFDAQFLGAVAITGGQFLGSRGDGLRMQPVVTLTRDINGDPLEPPAIAISGAVFAGNGADGMLVNVPAGQLAPVITGVDETQSGGVGLRNVGTGRINVSGNRFVSGSAFATPPAVNANNGL